MNMRVHILMLMYPSSDTYKPIQTSMRTYIHAPMHARIACMCSPHRPPRTNMPHIHATAFRLQASGMGLFYAYIHIHTYIDISDGLLRANRGSMVKLPAKCRSEEGESSRGCSTVNLCTLRFRLQASGFRLQRWVLFLHTNMNICPRRVCCMEKAFSSDSRQRA
jgi:hypothetical protein